MSEKPTGIDQSWGFANPQAAADAGIQVISGYLSHDSSKNLSVSDVHAYHGARSARCTHGIGVLMNWEGQAGAPLLGANQGRSDAMDAMVQAHDLIHGVGYQPRSKLSMIFSCDRDTNPGDYAKVDSYYDATAKIVRAAGFLNGAYGEYDLGNHLIAKKLIDVLWQAYAWSGGRLSPSADFYQFLNGQHIGGASVDFDRVIHPTKLGVWWPPGHPLNVGEDDMSAADVAAINAHIDATVRAQIKPITDHIDSLGGKIVHGDGVTKSGPNGDASQDAAMGKLNEILSKLDKHP